VVYEMRRANYASHEEMAYFWVGYISQSYWQCFEECKEYTLLTVFNLDLDLLFIYKFITKYFPFYPDLGKKLRSLSQFYAFLLTNNLTDILEKQKRDITYPNIEVLKLIPILKKFSRAKLAKGARVRDIKKKDIDSIVKKLETEFKCEN
jgi:hypothetical protein